MRAVVAGDHHVAKLAEIEVGVFLAAPASTLMLWAGLLARSIDCEAIQQADTGSGYKARHRSTIRLIAYSWQFRDAAHPAWCNLTTKLKDRKVDEGMNYGVMRDCVID